MELIERAVFLASLQNAFTHVETIEGHCVFVTGEAGIGKTSLIKLFSKEVKNNCSIYQGMCDALFAPRPLAPLYDILLQLEIDLDENNDITDRTLFFSKLFYELKNKTTTSVIIF